MKNKIKYSDGPIEEVKIVTDFLPELEELVFREKRVEPAAPPNSVERGLGLLKPAPAEPMPTDADLVDDYTDYLLKKYASGKDCER
jgi:hypothetical protein